MATCKFRSRVCVPIVGRLARRTRLAGCGSRNSPLAVGGRSLLALIIIAGFGIARGDDATGTRNGQNAVAKLDHADYKKNAAGEIIGVQLSGDRVTDDSLAYLKAFPHLRELKFQCCRNTTDRGLETIGELSRLKVLSFLAVKLDERGMAHLGKLSNLDELVLGCFWTEIGDKGLAHLSGLKGLRILDLHSNVHLSEKELEKLRAELPHCKIITYRATIRPAKRTEHAKSGE